MRDFKWGFSTLGCPECSLGEAVALADEYDFRMLELRSVDGSIDLPKVFEEPEKRAQLKRLAGEGRIRVFGSSFGISSRRNNYEELAALGRLADEAGVPYLRVFGGFDFAEELDSEKLTVALENLAWFRGQNLKAKLALETHDGYSSGSALPPAARPGRRGAAVIGMRITPAVLPAKLSGTAGSCWPGMWSIST